jgi:hypothetical protein
LSGADLVENGDKRRRAGELRARRAKEDDGEKGLNHPSGKDLALTGWTRHGGSSRHGWNLLQLTPTEYRTPSFETMKFSVPPSRAPNSPCAE